MSDSTLSEIDFRNKIGLPSIIRSDSYPHPEIQGLNLVTINIFQTKIQCNIPKYIIQVDIPTFVGFLRELENDYEVEDYARLYFGTGKGVLQFAQRFIEMRRKLKNQSGGGSGEKKKGKKGSRKNKNKANPDLLGETLTPTQA